MNLHIEKPTNDDSVSNFSHPADAFFTQKNTLK